MLKGAQKGQIIKSVVKFPKHFAKISFQNSWQNGQYKGVKKKYFSSKVLRKFNEQ